jgi:NAD(P)H-hydrate epimerase
MLRALTADQTRAVEQHAAEAGVSLAELMRAAGAAVAAEVSRRVPEGRLVVMCGPGNNGGDGWVAARELFSAGRDVSVLSTREPGRLGGVAAEAALDAISAGVPWGVPAEAPTAAELATAAGVVDALLGVGSQLPLRDAMPAWCAAVNASGAYVLSVDQPTGTDTDTGATGETAVHADCTVTFTAPKRGLLLFPGAAFAGEVVVADIGIRPALADLREAPEVWTAEEYSTLLPVPAPDIHKNARGRLLVIAGSAHYPGAAVLAARAAMRSGAGYVTLAVPDSIVHVAQSHLIAAPVVGLPASAGRSFSSAAATMALDLASDYDAVVLGPGITVADGAAAMARTVATQLTKPLLVDADGLNAFVDATHLFEERQFPTVLTPHPGELARLLGTRTSRVQADRVSSSARLAGPQRAVVLKGAGTITSADGRQVINTSGSPALATAGSGDVLSGIIGAFLAQGLGPLEAGALGAYVHGRAGESAAAELTPMCVTAEDIDRFLPVAMGQLLGTW